MNLELIQKHIHITKLPTGAEVMFGGQPCLTISESFDGGYFWKVNPIFAKLTYGANVFGDLPFCNESVEDLETAIASGLVALDEMNAFFGLFDTPEDTFSTGGIENMTTESVEELSEGEVSSATHHVYIVSAKHKTQGPISFRVSVKKGSDEESRAKSLAKTHLGSNFDSHIGTPIKAQKPQNNVIAESVEELSEADEQKMFSNAMDKIHPSKRDSARKAYDKMRKSGHTHASAMTTMHRMFTEEALESIKEDCRKAGLEHGESLLEAQWIAIELFEDFISEAIKTTDYHVTSEKSDKGFRPHIVHKDSGKTMYLGGVAYKTAEHAKDHAEAYLKAYGHTGANAADRAGHAFRKANKEHIVEETLDESVFDWKGTKSQINWKSDDGSAPEEPKKPGKRGKPTNIDIKDIHSRALDNVKAGLRPSAGMNRNEKIHFVRHLSNHPDFKAVHVSKAGRPHGTTKTELAKKETAQKATKIDNVFAAWGSKK